MTQPIALWIARIALLYLAIGVIFAVPFVITGAGRIDPAAHKTGWIFRVLLLVGSTLLWPLLLARWRRSKSPEHSPGEEDVP